ncbi:MAG: hypothetical protein AAFN70_11930, partial [Planctomycetota bacterium]
MESTQRPRGRPKKHVPEASNETTNKEKRVLTPFPPLGRSIVQIAAVGTAVETRNETDYDIAGRVTETRGPRYFDANDAAGHQKDKQTWTYTPSGSVATHTVAPGTPGAATESYTYDARGRRLTHTDFGGSLSTMHYDDCCGYVTASENALGHGQIRRSDATGRSIHTAVVETFADHASALDNPVNAKTLREQTTLHDGRGRPIASTTWIVPRDVVDIDDPPIAGLAGIPSADGFTTQYLYDDNLTDGIGLDSPAGLNLLVASPSLREGRPLRAGEGQELLAQLNNFTTQLTNPATLAIIRLLGPRWANVALTPLSLRMNLWRSAFEMANHPEARQNLDFAAALNQFMLVIQGGNTPTVSLSSALTKLAEAHANGGATTSFAADAPGSARVTISPTGEIRFSISDSAGRGVMSGILDSSNQLVTWNCTVHDETITIDDRTYAVSHSVDALGRQRKSYTDGLGRTFRNVDALGKETLFTHDLSGNQLSVRDPSGVSQDCIYDELGR